MPVIENDVSRLSDTLRFFYEMVALLPVMEQLPELFDCIYEKASYKKIIASIDYIQSRLDVIYRSY